MKKTFITISFTFLITACATEVGSERWCDMMDDKPKGEWTANDAGEYASSCVFGRDE